MHDYMVSLDLYTTKSISATELLNFLGLQDGVLNYWRRNAEDSIRKGAISPQYIGAVYWRFESRLDETLPLDSHIEDMTSLISYDMMSPMEKHIIDIGILIGASYYPSIAPFPTVRMSAKSIELICKKWPQADIEIIIYPMCDSDEESNIEKDEE